MARLHDGEIPEWRRAANRQQRRRAVGGRLLLTSERLIFTSNRLDRLTGGSDWSVDRDDVTAVDVAAPTLENGPFSGGLRSRLRLTLIGGTEELFVVRSPDRCATELADRLRT